MQRDSRAFVIFLASVSALTSISIDMSLPAVPSIERVYGLETGHGSLSLSLFLAGYAVTPLAGGPIADRFGRKPVLLASLALFALASVGCAAAPTFNLLLLCRILQGCASGMAVALPLAIVRDLFTGVAARQRISEVTTINGIMPLLAPIFGSWVIAAGGWRLIFVVQALFAVAVIAAAWFAFAESLSPAHRQTLQPARILRNYRQVFTEPTFVGYALVYALNFACIFAFISMSPLILMQTMGVSRSRYTVLFALTVTGTITGSFMSGIAGRRKLAVLRVLAFGLSVMAVASFAAVLTQLLGLHKPIALLPFASIVLFCFGFTSPAVMLEALETLPQLAGSGAGTIRSLQMIVGSAVSSSLAFLCASPRVHPATAATLTMFVITLGSCCLYFLALRPLSRSRSPT